MDKDWLWSLVGIGWAAWTLGGAGQKIIRRWLWPLVIVLIAIKYGTSWWLAVGSGGSLVLVHHLGYSPERRSLVWRVFIGASFGFALSPILWPDVRLCFLASILTSICFNGGMALSLRYNWIGHKWAVEGPVGAIQGAFIAWKLLN